MSFFFWKQKKNVPVVTVKLTSLDEQKREWNEVVKLAEHHKQSINSWEQN